MKNWRLRFTILALLVFSMPFLTVGRDNTEENVVRILAIGNSFSDDAVEDHLYEIATAAGKKLIIGNMYIGGCPLERHVRSFTENIPDYRYSKRTADGVKTHTKGVLLETGLQDEDWDVITFQQQSGLSGIYETWEAHLPALYEYVKSKVSSDVTFMIHQTWAYDETSTHRDFYRYEHSQKVMYDAIINAVSSAAELIGIKDIIPCGTAIQNARTTSLKSVVTRDGYHLHKTIGRYIAASTWFEKIFSCPIIGNSYLPEGMTEEQRTLAQNAVHAAVIKPLGVTVISKFQQTAQLRPEVFQLLDLNYPGLEKVRMYYSAGKVTEAASELLEYYRSRTGICTIDIRDIKEVTISKEHQKWADDALQHTFFVHKGYQPSFNYGSDINWKYWPIRDNELRFQLHRHKWFEPMGKAYRVSGDEAYAMEWTHQYLDWIRKNPMTGDDENAHFAWRPLEASHRLQSQPIQFQLFIDSPAFTAEFLTEFLVNYSQHAEHVLHNYSKKGNHLLFQAQRMLTAGTFFPEFKNAKTWRNSGVEILNREINVQVYDDGAQYELCPHYHLASIEIFTKALEIADINGFRNVFPQSFRDTVEKMIMFYANISYPDYSAPCFSDARIISKKNMVANYRSWQKIFPDNPAIQYWATEGKEGHLPENLSIGFLNSGFFVFRNSWESDAIQMVVKAGPPAGWHNQPDNGTFELWYNGKTLFQDSGSYVYAGDPEIMEQRELFRSTSMHNTLVLNDQNLETTDSKTLLWKPDSDVQILVTENQSYEKLKHRRSVFFVEGKYFVIVDEAVGSARGSIKLHYQTPVGRVSNSNETMHLNTENTDGANMKLQCFNPEPMIMGKAAGWVSTEYMQKQKRMNVSFKVKRQDNKPVRYITVIVPKEEPGNTPKITASFIDEYYNQNSLKVMVKVGKNKKRVLQYTLN